MRPLYIAVCGAGNATEEECDQAEEIGRLLAEKEAVVVTGGLAGVMEAAARGCSEAGGVAIGILSTDRPEDGNAHNSYVIATGLGEARNTIIVNSADALIAVSGEFGTLSEIAYALRLGLPVVGVGTWDISRPGVDVRIDHANDGREAVELALTAARKRRDAMD